MLLVKNLKSGLWRPSQKTIRAQMKHSLLHTNTKWESVKMRCLKNGFEASLFALLMRLGLLIQNALFCDLFSQFFGLCRHSEAVAALLRPKMWRVLLSFCNKDYFSLYVHSLTRYSCEFFVLLIRILTQSAHTPKKVVIWLKVSGLIVAFIILWIQ